MDTSDSISVLINRNRDSKTSTSSVIPLLNNLKQPQSQNLFEKGNYRIDYVLVYDKPNEDYKDKFHYEEKRSDYEYNLKKKGLFLEESEHENQIFVKVHAPNVVLKRYCEILKIRMPVKETVARVLNPEIKKLNHVGCCSKVKLIVGHVIHFFGVDTKWVPQNYYKLTEEYSQNRECLFDDDNTELFFSTSDRCMIVNFILEQVEFKDNERHHNVGITKLLELGAYSTAYPPHEGTINDPTQERGKLMQKWASLRNIFSYQPIDEIKDYFGMQFALYFAWVGFYTYMLVPASIIGVISVLYGLFTQEKNILGQEICDESQDMIMCPPCDLYCDYYNIADGCWYYKFRYMVDNNATYFFAFFMSIWSALYLKLWRRYSAEISHRWGLTGFSLIEEHPRPNYRSCRGPRKTKNQLTIREEPNVPFWTVKLPALMFSYSLVVLWIMLVLGFVFGIILYSMYCRSSKFMYNNSNKYQTIFFVPVTTGILTLIVINILNAFYSRAALWLTELEFQRTQMEFDDSLQLKIYLFQFMNYYTPIFYIAFLKGKFIGTPGKYIRLFGLRQEECDLGGCLLEVCIQLATFMVCEQLFNNFVEYIWPHLITFQRSWKERKLGCCPMVKELFKGICGMLEETDLPRWIEDIKLNPWDTEIFDEYLEMVIQYGFVTIFVTAFPLAPLLALFNNVFIEKHLDAKKFMCNYRRPIAKRVPNIGIWFYIMKIIAKISILTNAWIIASTTNLIPMLLYKYDNGGETKGFLNHSMSLFNVSKLESDTRPINSAFDNITYCRYPEFRDENYERTFHYWHVLVAKLVFVVFYQNVVSYIVTIIQWMIPDVPTKLRIKVKKENKHLSEQLLHEYETVIRRDSVVFNSRKDLARRRTLNPIDNVEEEDDV